MIKFDNGATLIVEASWAVISKNMCLYLSRDDFPNGSDECFRVTPVSTVFVEKCFGAFS